MKGNRVMAAKNAKVKKYDIAARKERDAVDSIGAGRFGSKVPAEIIRRRDRLFRELHFWEKAGNVAMVTELMHEISQTGYVWA